MRNPTSRSPLAVHTAASHFESLDPRQMMAADLAIAMVDNVPSFIVPGDKLTLAATISNQGDAIAKGPVTVRFLAPTNNADDPVDVVATVTKPINLKPGATAVITAKIVMNDHPAPGVYSYGANLSAADAMNASTDNDESMIENGFDLRLIFGTYGGRSNIVMSTTDEDGTIVTYSLKGAGYGEFDPADTVDMTSGLGLIGTDAATVFTIGTKGGDKLVNIDSAINIAGSLKSFSAKTANFTGSLAVGGSISDFAAADLTDLDMTIAGTAAAMKFKAGAITNLRLSSNTAMASLDFASWSWLQDPNRPDLAEDQLSTLSAPWIGKLTTKGEFSAISTLNGLNAPGVTLGQAKIGTFSGEMIVNGNVTSFAAATMDQGLLLASGVVGAVNIGSALTSSIWAHSLTRLDVVTINDLEVGAGSTFDATAMESLAAGNSAVITWAGGSIGAINVKGATTTAKFVAGVDPMDGAFLNGDDETRATGVIGKIEMKGAATGLSFAATTLPALAKIGGATITTATDERFLFLTIGGPTI